MEHIRINDKLRLERVKTDMAPVIFETINRDREYLKKWLPFVNYTLEMSDTERFLESVNNNGKDEIFSIWYNEEFAGLIGFKDIDRVNRKTEIGYWLAQKMQGKGIITDCVKKLCRYAFQKLKMNRVQIKVAEQNAKSEAIPLKLNFSFEGIERAGELHEDKFVNLKVYSLLANERFED
ncbi:GNAT family N-acetyltransferase [Maribellus sediminis]|uniref:GNAT family N-acetyltransferase n=1 Tax=Maribellus sediminis TaxID=2696285 RepID=UPI00143099D7|nr:GNAT family protein [Maribellus sediminis]